MLPNFSLVRPHSLAEAVEHLQDNGAFLHAGGTDLLGCLRDRVFDAEKLVSLGRLQNLRGIEESRDGGVRIGAMTTLSEVAGSLLIGTRYLALAQAALEVASPQLRHQGTIGGNLCQKPRCWYYRGEFHCLRKGGEICHAAKGENEYHCILGGKRCFIVHPSDTAAALTALGAEIGIIGSEGTRSVPVEAFHVPPEKDPRRETMLEKGEVVTEILLPPGDGMRSSYRKVRARQAWDFALAGAALALHFEGEAVKQARIVLSGAAPVPWRARQAEEALTGKPLTPETISRAAEAAVAGARPLKQNRYKVGLFKGIIEEELSAFGRR